MPYPKITIPILIIVIAFSLYLAGAAYIKTNQMDNKLLLMPNVNALAEQTQINRDNIQELVNVINQAISNSQKK
jgi:uncharacterized protein YneF (UPF0154 family)